VRLACVSLHPQGSPGTLIEVYGTAVYQNHEYFELLQDAVGFSNKRQNHPGSHLCDFYQPRTTRHDPLGPLC
jgi:hypothetical protein